MRHRATSTSACCTDMEVCVAAFRAAPNLCSMSLFLWMSMRRHGWYETCVPPLYREGADVLALGNAARLPMRRCAIFGFMGGFAPGAPVALVPLTPAGEQRRERMANTTCSSHPSHRGSSPDNARRA